MAGPGLTPKQRRAALRQLSRDRLAELSDRFELEVKDRRAVNSHVNAIIRSRSVRFEDLLEHLTRDELKAVCEALDLSPKGREKQTLVDRIRAASDNTNGAQRILPLEGDEVIASEAASALNTEEATNSPSVPKTQGAQSGTTNGDDAAFGDDDSNPGESPPGDSQKPAKATGEYELALEVLPRNPRLAWQGMDRKDLAPSVPTQVVEIVQPRRVVERGPQLEAMDVHGRRANDTELPPNRLIWTNDNLVALRSLLDERDPHTGDYRYRGKVDLVYIDPPFMVNNDFRADNAINIDLVPDHNLHATREPSLVEILAYKDTWRQGLDSFLSMLRARLLLLRDLLSPRGTIYVHLDWHAAHYVKVLMDEIFGYEKLVNEIIWQRQTSHSDTGQGARHLGRLHDTILCYRAGESPYFEPVYVPYDGTYVRSHYRNVDEKGRRFQYGDLSGPGGAAKGNAYYELMGFTRYWRYSQERMQELVAQGRVEQPAPGKLPRYKRFLSDMAGVPVQDVWDDLSPINSQAKEALSFPTQKPVALIERIIKLSCPPDGVVLDCFAGSGTTCEAAERIGRRWIGIDNGKYAVHLARKRLIQLDGQPRPPEQAEHEYVECEHCKNVERKPKPQRRPGPFEVRPFTVENMGAYQRAERWQDFQTRRSIYRDEMIRVFGGEPVNLTQFLHGKKGRTWIHVGPLDGPVSSSQVWAIARDAAATDTKQITVLSADFDTLSATEKDQVERTLGVKVTIRIIPASAIDEIRRRLEHQQKNPDEPYSSTAVPAFYSPLAIVLRKSVNGRLVKVTLERCEVDIESFLDSQRPLLKPITEGMSAARRKKAQAERERWEKREEELRAWLDQADSWKSFVDFWAVDWDYMGRVGPDGKPIFETDWQSFRIRKSKKEVEPLVFTAERNYEQPGQYTIAARVTDVFGNDGIATVTVNVE